MSRSAWSLVLVAAACSREAVSLEIAFREPPPPGPIFLWASVEERSEPRVPGPVLSGSGPVEYLSSGAELVVPGVPFGPNRVAVVVARARPNADEPLSYYGLSEPFDLGAQTKERISVLLDLVRTPPRRPDTETSGRIRLERKPWGTEAAPEPQHVIRGAAGAAPPFATVIAFDPELRVERGRAAADAAGQFIVLLGSSDRRDVAVASEDGVGGLSIGQLVRDGEWVATFLSDATGVAPVNPHRLSVFGGSPIPGSPLEPGRLIEGAPLSRVGGLLRVAARRAWREFSVPSDGPGPRHDHAMAYDTTRGRLVLFGGSSLTDDGAGSLGDTWEWDGGRWHDVSSPD